MKPILVCLLLCLNSAYAKVQSYDLEVQTLSNDTPSDIGQVQVKPTVTFGLTQKTSLTTGALIRFQDNDRPTNYGVYAKLTYKPHQ